MTKKEIIWREILYQTIEKNIRQFKQKNLAKKFSFSLSTVSNALRAPRQLQTIRVGGRGFEVRDIEKLLYLWATHRNFSKDIIYVTHLDLSMSELENSAPSGAVYATYTAYKKHFNETPADYDKVYIYIEEKRLENLKKRFPQKKGYQNLIVLKADPFLKSYGSLTSLAQTFADLWNLEEWYAKDFLEALKGKIIKR